MFSGYIMTLHTHGIKEGSKEETPDEAKVKEEEKVKAKAEEAEDTSNQEDQRAKEREEEKTALIWWEKKDMKKTGKKKKNGMIPVKAIGPTIKTGMMPSGQKICATRMSMVTSRRKEKARKERKVRKERMMKEKENPGDGKGKSNYVQPSTSSNPPIQNQQQQQAHYSSAASSSGHGFVTFSGTDPVRVDVLNANYEEENTRRTRRGGQNMRDANAQTLRERKKTNPVHVGQLCVSRRPQVHFPALEGDVDTLRQRLHEVPLQPGLQPDQQGTSFLHIWIL